MIKIALVGGFGGIAPSLVDKAQAFASGETEVWLRTASSPFISILCAFFAIAVYFAIGAVIAAIYEKQELQKALLLGIGAPALILAATTANSIKPKTINVESGALFGFIGSAYAQNTTPRQQLDLKAGPNLSKEKCVTCGIKFVGKNGEVLSSAPLSSGSEQATIAVPKDAEKIILSGDNTNSAAIDLNALGASLSQRSQQQGTVTLDVDVNRSYWNDLSRSFGSKSVQPYDFDVKVAPQ